ncbi:MAG: FG-GAP repeat protein [Candidatus Polarisedimenticolia bacterium]
MNTHTQPSTRLLSLSIPALVAAALWAPAPAGAQQIPWIGLAANGAQLLGEVGTGHNSPGAEDHFGFAVAAGDFNGDGFDDLASGIPGNDCDFVVWDCGSVQVRFGREVAPLLPWGVLNPVDNPNEPAEASEENGYALATGDFNNDGHADLAVGVPGDRTDHPANAFGGSAHIHYGLPVAEGGIQWLPEHILRENDTLPDPPGSGSPQSFDLGKALAVGDFNGDGHDDLAIGDPQYWIAGQAGGVWVAHGHVGGLVPFEGFLMRQGLDGLPDVPEAGDQFGHALAAGDFNDDGFDDLAIGVPQEDGVGAVLVVYGSPFSLIFSNHWWFGHFDLGLAPQPGSRFGAALAVGDVDGDGHDDLAVSAPKWDGLAAEDIGLLTVLYGTPSGLTPQLGTWLWEDVLYGAGNSEAFDDFGRALAAGDFDGNGVDDLAIGIAGENNALADSGAVAVVLGRPGQALPGAARPLRPGPAPNPVGLIPDVESGQPFYGSALAAGDFDGNGFDDLAIGAPGRDVPGAANAGGVAVVYGQLFADGFEAGSAGAWSSASP